MRRVLRWSSLFFGVVLVLYLASTAAVSVPLLVAWLGLGWLARR